MRASQESRSNFLALVVGEEQVVVGPHVLEFIYKQ